MGIRFAATATPPCARAVLVALVVAASDGAFADNLWKHDLTPISRADWSRESAAHLLERAGFGGTPGEVERLAAMSPRRAVRALARGREPGLAPFEHSGVFDPGLDPFPPSRPATTNLAKQNGRAIGGRYQSGR